MFGTIRNYFEVLVYLVEGFLIFIKNFKFKTSIMIACIIILLGMNYYFSGSATLFRSFLIVLAAYKFPYKKMANSMFRAYVIAIVLGVLLFFLGLSDSGKIYRGRFSYGFTAANGIAKFIVIALLIYLSTKDLFKRKECLLIIVTALASIVLFATRTAIITLILIFPIYYIFKKLISRSKGDRVKKKLMISSYGVMLGISILLVYLYTRSAFVGVYLDKLLNVRLYENYNSVVRHGITLLGQNVELWYSGGEIQVFQGYYGPVYSSFMTVDCSYIESLIILGAIPTLLLMIWNGLIVKSAWEDKKIVLCTVITCMNLYAFTESGFSDIFIFFPFLYTFSKERLSGRRLKQVVDFSDSNKHGIMRIQSA